MGFQKGRLGSYAGPPVAACQRLPTRLTGPPRFIGVPGRPATTAARATGRGRNTTPGLATQPVGYETYWQYTTALASLVLAATNPAISSAANAIESFIFRSSIQPFKMLSDGDLRFDADQGVRDGVAFFVCDERAGRREAGHDTRCRSSLRPLGPCDPFPPAPARAEPWPREPSEVSDRAGWPSGRTRRDGEAPPETSSESYCS